MWTRVLLIPLDPRTTHRPIVSVRSDGAHQGNRMAAINLVRYNWTKKVRATFITAISLALMAFARSSTVCHVSAVERHSLYGLFLIYCQFLYVTKIIVNFDKTKAQRELK